MNARDRTELQLWRVAAVYLAAIYAGLYPLQFVLDFLRQRNLLRFTIALAFAAGAGALVVLGRRCRWRPGQWLVAGLGTATMSLAALRLDVVQERLHLVEYGLLGLLFWAALARRDDRLRRTARGDALRRVVLSTLLAAGAGWLDEGIQAALPNRVYDLGDVGINAGAGALAACFAEIHRRAGRIGRSAP